jgi:F420-dependent oxidoreductase-like protein
MEDSMPLRVGIVVDNPNFPESWDHVVAKVRLADELGYDSGWLGETWGYELFTSLADLVRETRQIKLGAGIANVFSRSPAVIATSIATLDERSGGRMLLGLGASGPQVIEHWHGVPFRQPLRRTREYAEIIATILRREPLTYQGEIFHLERGFKLRFKPVRSHVPIYLASLSPKNVELAGAIADGVLPVFWPRADFATLRADLDRASQAAGRPAGSVAIAPYLTTALIADESQRAMARWHARAPVAWYVGRMGTFYAEALRRHGFDAEVQAIIAGWQSGPDAAAAAVSDELLDATALVGTPSEMADLLRQWVAAGIDQPLISMPPGDPESAGALLAALRDDLQRLPT